MKLNPQDLALLDKAMDLPTSARQRWLDELSEAARAHRPILERMLCEHAGCQTNDFLRELPRVDGDDAAGTSSVAPGNGIVGSYRLLSELGRGGMGSLWLAERIDGMFGRQLAVKLPHPGLATRGFAERLMRERDILASLDHPHIARLYDAGFSESGQPYIALAYVEGRTLIEHCDAEGLGVNARIDLFQQVLDAVQYARAHLVIRAAGRWRRCRARPAADGSGRRGWRSFWPGRSSPAHSGTAARSRPSSSRGTPCTPAA